MDRTLALFIGLPGQGMHLGIDPLSLLFLGMLAPQVVASAAVSEWKSGIFWVFVLGMVLALLAADAFALILGFELMSAASWLLVLRGAQEPGSHKHGAGQPASLYAGIAIFSAACLIPAMFLPAGNIAFALLLLGVGAQAGIAPLHSVPPAAHPAPPAGVSAVMSGGMVKVALYIIIRYGFVVYGNEISLWWDVALMVAGAGSVIIGALRAVLEVELKTVLACSTVEHVGLIAVGLGIALAARAMDEPAVAVLAIQGALLCAIAHALFKPMLFLGAGAVQAATGTTSLDWLGGLMRGMPRLGLLMLLGAASMAAMPLSPGFVPEFLLLHAVIAAAGSGGILAWIGCSALLGILGLGAALGLAAAVRIIGIGFLGRPRTLRAAAAEEAPTRVLLGMGLLAVLSLVVALAPGVLLWLVQPVIALLVPGALPQPLMYAPLPLAVLLLAPVGGAFLLLRRFGARGEREAPAWNGGFGRPPAWLPFGDPMTQPSATGFAEPVRIAMGGILLRENRDRAERYILQPAIRLTQIFVRLAERIRRATIRQRLAVVFAALLLALLALGLEQGG